MKNRVRIFLKVFLSFVFFDQKEKIYELDLYWVLKKNDDWEKRVFGFDLIDIFIDDRE